MSELDLVRKVWRTIWGEAMRNYRMRDKSLDCNMTHDELVNIAYAKALLDNGFSGETITVEEYRKVVEECVQTTVKNSRKKVSKLAEKSISGNRATHRKERIQMLKAQMREAEKEIERLSQEMFVGKWFFVSDKLRGKSGYRVAYGRKTIVRVQSLDEANEIASTLEALWTSKFLPTSSA